MPSLRVVVVPDHRRVTAAAPLLGARNAQHAPLGVLVGAPAPGRPSICQVAAGCCLDHRVESAAHVRRDGVDLGIVGHLEHVDDRLRDWVVSDGAAFTLQEPVRYVAVGDESAPKHRIALG